MKLKEQKWSECECCGSRKDVIQDESYGCDNCKEPIDEQLNVDHSKYHEFLEISVHKAEGGPSTRYHFCSWGCLFKKMKKIKCDNFISLPFLTFEATRKGIRPRDFWKAIRDFK